MLRAYKYELRPTELQKTQLTAAMGACRFIFNLSLETKIASYRAGKNVTAFDLMKQLTELKKEVDWLNIPQRESLDQSIIHMDEAFQNFFKGKTKFPSFKKKHSKQAFKIPSDLKVDFNKWAVRIPKIGHVEFNRDRVFSGEVRQGTVSKTTTGRYYISILVKTEFDKPELKPILGNTTIGIDLGIKHFATLSDGCKIENPKNLVAAQKKLRIAQRSLSRKKKGSKRRQRQKLVVSKIYEKVTNKRNDFLHKLSIEITNQYDSIAIENLNVAGMVKNRKLSKHISDAGWGTFESYLKYKAGWYGKNILQIGRFEPSSKMCSCGVVNNELNLSQRAWTCESCGTTHDRDVLAAQNIKKLGLRTQPNERQREAIACA